LKRTSAACALNEELRAITRFEVQGAYADVDPYSVPPQLLLERILTLEIVRVTERAAVSGGAAALATARRRAADQAAVDAMRRELNKLPIEGTIVIGEGEARI